MPVTLWIFLILPIANWRQARYSSFRLRKMSIQDVIGSCLGIGRSRMIQVTTMPLSVGKTVVNIVYSVVLGIILVTGFIVLVPRFQNYRLLSGKRSELERINLALQQDLSHTQRMQRRFLDDPEFVERVARENKRVRPGEITFIFAAPAE